MKVRTRMMIVFVAIVFLGFVYLMFFVNTKLKPVYLKPIEDDLVDFAAVLASQIALDSDAQQLDTGRLEQVIELTRRRGVAAQIYDYLKLDLELRVYVTDRNGIVVYDSFAGQTEGRDFSGWRDVNLTLHGEYGARATWDRTGTVPEQILYVAAPVVVADELIGVVTVGKAIPAAYSLYRDMEREAWLGVIWSGLLALAWGIFVTIWVTRPIRRLTEYVEAVRDGRRQRLPDLGKSDIGLLGESFEEMRDALEGKRYVERYVQTLTHEIKSPLSAIKGASELLHEDLPPDRREAFLHNIQTETLRIQNLVDRMLELAALESRKSLKDPRRFSIGELVREVLRSLEPLLTSKSLQLDVEVAPDFTVEGERFLVSMAISNMIHNAIAFTPRGGVVRVRVGAGEIRIQDSGPGIPEYAVDRVFEKFYSLRRPDTGKKSSGLGLSIVREVAKLHQGEARLRNHEKGGAEAVLRFGRVFRTKVTGSPGERG